MLELVRISSLQDRRSLHQSFDPVNATWLVSDLRSKFEIQNQIMNRQGFFEDHSVLRASELWSLLMKRFAPQFKIVSRDFIKSWLREKLSDSEIEVARHHGEETLVDFLETVMQVVSHPEGSAHLYEWLEEQDGARQRWGVWFTLAQSIAEEVLADKKICQKWIAPWLSNQFGWELNWRRPLIVDLGGELTRAESSLLQTLAQDNHVLVLEPGLGDSQKYKFLLQPYEELRGFAKKIGGSCPVPQAHDLNVKNQESFRLSGPLAEAKQAVQTVRQWLNSGINPEQIAVIAGSIENYWPTLEVYFAQEGIPVSKDSTVRLPAIPTVNWWLARLRVATRNFIYPDLEVSAYPLSEPSLQRFEKFHALFRNLLDAGDLSRDSAIFKAYGDDKIPEHAIPAERFLGVIIRFWPEDANVDHLEAVLREILQTADAKLQMKFSTWVYWLEQIICKSEIPFVAGVRNGIQVIGLSSSDSASFTHRIFLGLTESSFRDSKVSLISPSEIEKIFLDIGFHMAHPDQSALEFQLEWVIQSPAKSDHFYFPMTNISASAEAPHPIWLKIAGTEPLPISVPEGGRFDAILKQNGFADIAEILHWDQDQIAVVREQMDRDGGEDLPLAPILGFSPLKLSASALELYQHCPFKFAAGKLFHLLDPIEMDLGVDPRSQGSLIHKIFEILTVEPRRYDWSNDEIAVQLDQIYAQNPVLGDFRLWPPLREKLARLSQRFLQYEMETSTQRKKTSAQEHRFSLQMAGHQWSGAIDRIDEMIDGSLLLFDYKATQKSYGIKSWLKNNHLQLGFYAWALENGWIEGLKDKKLAGAQYYIYKNFKMFGVLVEDEKSAKLLPEFYQNLEKMIEDLSQNIVKGNFPAVPRDKEKCKDCDWSRLCRAPHLNQ